MYRQYAEHKGYVEEYSVQLRSAVFIKDGDSPAYTYICALYTRRCRPNTVAKLQSRGKFPRRNSKRSPTGQLRLSLHENATVDGPPVMDPSPAHVIIIMDAQRDDIT